ncbi:MAG: iron-sulfur cluster assembly scaffold protein [Nanoarchaeota archaeon]
MKKYDIKSGAKGWFYSRTVKEHFLHPRNFLTKDKEKKYKADGIGYIGSVACGDVMQVWIKVDRKKDVIKNMKWRTYGCGSAISSTSMLSIMVKGMKINKALKIKPQDIIKKLGGLPARKYHCSVLGDKALRDAINDYFRRTKQFNRIIAEGARIIDPTTKTTDKDIEKAVKEGAVTLQDVQKRLKVGIGNLKVIPEVEQLIRFYKRKYSK